MPDFVHLHLHTLYSLLDGAIRIKDLLKTVQAKGMKSVAVTESRADGTRRSSESGARYWYCA